MLKGLCAGIIEGQDRVHGGVAVFHKAAVRIGIDAPSGTGGDHLSNAFRVLSPPGRIAAFFVLCRGQPGECRFCGSGNGCLILVVYKGLQRHGGDIGIRGGSGQSPAAAFQFFAEDIVNALLADGGVRCLIAVGIQRNQGKDGPVDALLLDPVKILIRGDQIPITHRSSVLADGGERQNQAGIIGGFVLMERAVCQGNRSGCFVDVFHNAVIVACEVSVVLFVVAAASQAKYGPFSAGGAENRLGDGSCQLCHGIVQNGADILTLASFGLIRLALRSQCSFRGGNFSSSSGQILHRGHDGCLCSGIIAQRIGCIHHVLVHMVKIGIVAPAGAETQVSAVAMKRELPTDNIEIAIIPALTVCDTICKNPVSAAHINHEVIYRDHPARHGAIVKFTQVFIGIAVVFLVAGAAIFGDDSGNIQSTCVETFHGGQIHPAVP